MDINKTSLEPTKIYSSKYVSKGSQNRREKGLPVVSQIQKKKSGSLKRQNNGESDKLIDSSPYSEKPKVDVS